MISSLRQRWSGLDRDELRLLQGRQLRTFLRQCVVPFSAHYARVFAESGLKPEDIRSVDDLARLPFTSKRDLLPTPESPKRVLDFVLKPQPDVLRRRPATIMRALTRGKAGAREALEREWRPCFMTSTTGRSTEPVPFLYTQHDLANLSLGGGRVVEIGNCQPDEKLLNLFPYAPHLAYWLVHHGCLAHNLFQIGTGGGKFLGTTGNVRLIKRIQPSILVGMPTFLYHVLREAVDEECRVEGLRLLVLGGEKVPTGMRRKLAALCAELGSPHVQTLATYGFTEAKMAWSECPGAPGDTPVGYHLFPDLGIVEIIDPETGQVVPDGTPGEIVYTPIDARGTVVLRYRTGDRIDGGLVHQPCPVCGRRLPRLVGRISRVSEVHALQLQKVKGTIIDFNEVEHLLDDLTELSAWQVELRKRNDDPHELDELVIHVCSRNEGSREALAERIRTSFADAFEVRPNAVEFHPCEEIRRLQKVGEALKEEKFVDRRPEAEEEGRVDGKPFKPLRASTAKTATPA